MTTKVIHIKNTPKNYKSNSEYVYVGRPSIFGNPYTLIDESKREEVIQQYKQYFEEALQIEEFKNEVLKLKNKILVCYCNPLRCHADIIAEYLNALSS